MRRSLTALALTSLFAAQLSADVRVSSATTVEGAIAAMMGGAVPRVVMSIKGMKARTDVELGAHAVSAISDLDSEQFIVLNAAEKTAHVMTPAAVLPEGAPPITLPKLDAAITPTGKSQTIAGVPCEEFTVSMSMSMAEMMASAQMAPEMAAMMKTIRFAMNGRMWVARSGPGVAEYMAYQTASTKGQMASMLLRVPALRGSGLDRLMHAFANAGGIPYLTELALTIEGNDKISEFMKQQGPVKITTKVTEVSTDPIPDAVFTVPEGYKIVK